jgi:hypothetical protein
MTKQEMETLEAKCEGPAWGSTPIDYFLRKEIKRCTLRTAHEGKCLFIKAIDPLPRWYCNKSKT